MIKQLFTFGLAVLLCQGLSAQLQKRSTLVSLQGNYHKGIGSSGVTFNKKSNDSKQLALGAGIEYFISNHISLGIGLNYYWTKEERSAQLYSFDELIAEQMTLKQKSWLPEFSVSYYQPIVKGLYFSTALSFAYGSVDIESESITTKSSNILTNGAGNEVHIGTNNQSVNSVSSNKFEDTKDFTGIALAPRLHYFFQNGIGVFASLGGIQYTMLDWESDRSSFSLDFAPKYWEIGFQVAF